MSRTPLLDKLRAADPTAPWWIDRDRMHLWRRHRDGMLQILRDKQLPAFQIGEIAKYYFEFEPREYWDFDELEGLKAPYGCAWMEHPLPHAIRSEIGDSDVGKLLTGGDAGFLVLQPKRSDVEGERIPAEAHTLLLFEIFTRYEPLAPPNRTEGPLGTWMFALDRAGKILGVPAMQGYHNPVHNEHLKPFQSLLWPALLACSEASIAGLREPAWIAQEEPHG